MPSIFLNEARAIFSTIPGAAYYMFEDEPKNPTGTALVLSGWLGPQAFYGKFRHHLREFNLRTIFLPRGLPHRQIVRTDKQFREGIADIISEVGQIDYVFGHSAGAIEALKLLLQMSRLKKVFAIGPAFELGISPQKLRFYECLGVIPELLKKHCLRSTIRNVQPHSKRVVTISSVNDWLCPSSAAKHLPDATNYVIEEHFMPKRQLTHVGMLESPEVLEIIEQELNL